MSLSPEELAVVGTLGGALIGALPQFVSSLLNRRTEEKRQFRELAVRSAIESWKFIAEHSGGAGVMPLEHYIMHTALMCEFTFSGEKVTAEAASEKLREIDSVMQVLFSHAKSVTAKPREA
ncbi:MAG TPA: hypothetical protein PLD21_09410 [Rhodocyclaceae bacterium]|nr:hypothetical protein [Rhodocyclaceae bacterium]HNA67858.1 hypothetical protein [Rhodocyclaceae bacterium]HNC80723.1 hypothetical protein [Rhodocyclaceae bacterium]